LNETLQKAKLKDFVKKLPFSVSTKTNESGVELSGGQRKRIAIARAFYRQPEVYILDEITSEVDERVERKILAEIRRTQKTSFVISHRKLLHEYCDRLLRVEDGKAFEMDSLSVKT